MSLELHETWDVLDATKIQQFMDCPRQYFFRYVLGWSKEQPDVPLVFGSAAHHAFEVLLREGYSLESIQKGFALFLEEYRATFPETMDDVNAPRTPANFLRALVQYIQHYKDDDFNVLHTEVAGSAMISDTRRVHWKMDSIVEDKDGVFSLEHKTSTRLSRQWMMDWRQKMQVGIYTHVLYCLYPEERVRGVVINGVFVTNPPGVKADGTPYKNARDTEFCRVPIRKTMEAMEDWLVTVEYWTDSIYREFEKLAAVKESDAVLAAFPKNTQSCTKYFGCPFADHCAAWRNPLQHVEDIPIGFHREFWDPRSWRERAKETIEV